MLIYIYKSAIIVLATVSDYACNKQISGIFQTYLRNIQRISWVYLWFISDVSLIYLVLISGISYIYPRYISNISIDFRYNSTISQVYLLCILYISSIS